ncbi:MBOAT family O-acyltransferase [Cohnella sp. JJ-181]|uniref:MBOAT family O-acyltransferase n=1 Tax=Cohnella rhizoplanae TaxID=2974897 RepID=UPI0022FFA184|nr:MBOAT family protein [Cohnella sp. JJ-181]CAI6051797.1 Peptidoglycan O-acetyltransferase [Cohnella sp. JJ-181]
MLFNSYPFIFVFLPVTVAGYFLLARLRARTWTQLWLAAVSLVFYAWWSIEYVPLLLMSIGFNFGMGRLLARTRKESVGKRRAWLAAGIAANLLLLGWYKYANFFAGTLSDLTGFEFTVRSVVLPLGISFFTFTQIAYLVDAWRGTASEYNLVNYVLFVTFFPHLIAGPILHHREMMPQFADEGSGRPQWTNIYQGTYFFCMGLAKKVIVADTFAGYANDGFAHATGFFGSWAAALSYTFQLYFDFSGYSDMAVGIALLFNVRLPQNFDSPYKAAGIRDFWRRWHMTLSRFLRDYIYIPLGGNRKGEIRACLGVLVTFLIGGLWHGAGWTFIVWGALHGMAQIIQRLWSLRIGVKLPFPVSWLLTFLFINATWVLFRAEDLQQAERLLAGMAGLRGGGSTAEFLANLVPLLLAGAGLLLVLLPRNVNAAAASLRPSTRLAFTAALLFVLSLLFLNRIQPFLYFNF